MTEQSKIVTVASVTGPHLGLQYKGIIIKLPNNLIDRHDCVR